MKTLIILMLTFLSFSVFAAPTQVEVENQALEILLKNSGRLTSEEGESVASVLASSLLTGTTTKNEISNSCSYDSNDSVFKCTLSILNSDNPGEGGTESSTGIIYELEKAKSGLPSDELFSLTVLVIRAG
jgi:hypothetical protein